MKLGLFTADQVCALCGISARQLAYWDKTGLFKPRYTADEKRSFNRIYSFRDVVGLRTIGRLRNKYGVPLNPDLRQISEDLKKTPDADWSKLVFYEDPIAESARLKGASGQRKRRARVYFRHPNSGDIIASSPHGQQPLFEMRTMIQNVERNLARMNRRKPKQIGKVEQHRYVVRNEPVIAGTRIPTAAVYRLHKAGFTSDAILREFPRLQPVDVDAAIKHERVKVAS
ncbi:MAG: DUF433 domain-containing protein [Candidatus Binataceae bacterium]|nr:DUF433 domain-containing protein [Candidatus Binataceae bacterium]